MGFLDLFKKGAKQKEPYVAFGIVEEEKGSYQDFYDKVKNHSLIMLITGKRGSGKTSLGMKLLELFGNETKRKCYVLGYGSTKMPFWIKKSESIEKVPNNSTVLFDEGAILFSARESMKNANKELGKVMAIARHKNLTLILIAQNSAMIDLNVLRLADTLLLKEPSLLQSKFERKAIRDIYETVSPKFKEVKMKKAHFYVWDDDFQGLLKYSLPEFWNDKISKSFRNF
ncbi:ATP-binding protein [Candidatus Woesearchaeota archaeon]|nr:ATP-binding protein [Candidatus Woesearchaeota archaeon]